jgi:hypothetical protein
MARTAPQTHPIPASALAAWGAVGLMLTLGCTALEHRSRAAEVAGLTLAVASEEGAAHLALESKLDLTVRGYVTTNGKPQYLHVADGRTVYFFYTNDDQVAIFLREFMARSEVRQMRQIPGHLLTLLPKPERARILARRADKKRRAAARRGRPGSSGPAAPAPGPRGWSDNLFDVNTLVRRLRIPLTAADQGVTGWKRETLADGSLRRSARSGSTLFEVRANRVSFSIPIAARSVSTPRHARSGYHRVNKAVFGASAESVNRFVAGIIDQVSRDASGRTRISRRVAGRTVNIVRVPSSGVLVYAVHP